MRSAASGSSSSKQWPRKTDCRYSEAMELRATVDVSEAVAGLDDLQKRQIPFALAKTLTGCAKVGQAKVQEGLAGKFTLRNDFTLRSIRIKPAEKKAAVIEADVHTSAISMGGGSGGWLKHELAPDYLLPQEEGGEKVPHAGHEYLAVPTRYLRALAPGIIPTELRPGNLLGAVAGRYTVIERRTKQIQLNRQKIVKGLVFFIQEIGDGHKAIMGRSVTSRIACPFYLLIPEARIKPRLEMERDVDEAVQAAFPELWAENWRQIMARGLRIQG